MSVDDQLVTVTVIDNNTANYVWMRFCGSCGLELRREDPYIGIKCMCGAEWR